ncbi:MAG: hypothetical protein AMS22_04160 [Thiotrichales bacterium SG8_50]|nr:MAG: hypothetical protein AMS22_04160 [Thiotrichales bacterium SG8_50]
MPHLYRPVAASCALLALGSLAGCGGGGDGGFSAPNINTALVQITSANQEEVVAVAYDSVGGSSETAGELPLPIGIVAAGGSDKVQLLDIALAQVDRALRRGKPAADATVSAYTVSDSVQCDYRGSISISANVASADSFDTEIWSSGDTATIVFNNCAFDAGDSVSGSIGITLHSDFDPAVLDNPELCTPDCSVSMSISINNFTVSSTDGWTATVHGDLALDRTITPTTISETTSSNSLWFFSSDGFAMHLSGLETTNAMDVSQLTYSYDSTVTVASTAIDGSINVSAQLSGTLSGFSYDTYTANDPNSGTLTITGANSQLTANVSGDTLTLLLDSDGDGNDDEMTTITWTQL